MGVCVGSMGSDQWGVTVREARRVARGQSLFRSIQLTLGPEVSGAGLVELKYQFPWFYSIVMSFLLCGIIGGYIQKNFKWKKERLASLFFVITLFTFGLSMVFSFAKMSKINNHLRDGKLITERGKVDGVEIDGGKDIVSFMGREFEIKDHDLYCLSDRKVFSANQSFEISYINLGRWAGFEASGCILHASKIE